MDIPPLPPPSPFSSPSSPFHLHIHSNNSFPVIAIAIIGILATAFLLVAYYVFVIKCCLNWHRIDVLNRLINRRHTPDEMALNFNSLDGNDHQKGLDEAVIRSIPVIKFRKSGVKEKNRDENGGLPKCEEQSTAIYECSVCLSEFEDGEKLRVIPNCCHAFHIDCIDIWLQTSANCPLCRSLITPSSVFCNTGRVLQDIRYPNSDNFDGNDEDYVVIEIKGNNLDEPRVVSNEENTLFEEKCEGKKKGLKMDNVGSVGDEWIEMRDKYDEFGDVQPIRRSISMDLSMNRDLVVEIEQCSRVKHGEIVTSSGSSLQNYSTSSGINSGKIKRSIFSFGYGRSSKVSIQPLHLDS